MPYLVKSKFHVFNLSLIAWLPREGIHTGTLHYSKIVPDPCGDHIRETTIFDATNIIQNSSECEMLLKSLYLCSFRPTYL